MGRNDNNDIKFVHTPSIPYDASINSYFSRGGLSGVLLPYQITGWQHESLSWKRDCYLHTMLSGPGKGGVLRGREAEKLLSYAFVNNFSLEKFPIGSGKHIICCTPKGNIGCDGMCHRLAEDTFATYTREPFIAMYAASGKFDIEPFEPKKSQVMLFQLGGPRSLEVLENVVQEDFHDLKFMRFRPARIRGYDVRVIRMGMAGTLAYEIHADNLDHIFEMYEEVLTVGKQFGLCVLGRLAYMSNHTENGFPQQGFHFMCDWSDPAVDAYMGREGSVDGGDFRTTPLRGSLKDQGRSAYWLNPFEAGWNRSINWNHDFVGRQALIEIRDNPRTRRIVSLEWNPKDVLKVFDTYFDDVPGVAREMLIPQNLLENPAANLQDKVVDASGRMIGKSTGRLYTLYYKRMISMAFVDPEYAEIGRELTVIWGEPGTRQIPIRARVARYPYLDLTPNAKYNLDSIPRYTA
jgi:glycine cleavage system aminomethyltransferase T